MKFKILLILIIIITLPFSASSTEDEISIFNVKKGDTLNWEVVYNYESPENTGAYTYIVEIEIIEVNSTRNQIKGNYKEVFLSGDEETFSNLHGDGLSSTMIEIGPIIGGHELDERPIEDLNPSYWHRVQTELSDGIMDNYTTVWMEDYYYRNVTEYFEENYSSYKYGRSFEWSVSNNWGNLSSIYFKYDFSYKKSDGIMYEHQYYRKQGDIINSYSISLIKKNYLPIPLYSSPMFVMSLVAIIAVLIIYYRIKYQKSSNQ